MVDQAPLSGNYAAGQRPEGVVGSVAEFGNDVATLAELQARLAVIDLKEASGKALVPAVVLVVAALLTLGAVPVVLLGLGALLADGLDLDRGWGYLIVAGLTLVLAAVAAIVALPGLSRSLASFRRSREELTRNLAWIKTVLLHSGRAASRLRP